MSKRKKSRLNTTSKRYETNTIQIRPDANPGTNLLSVSHDFSLRLFDFIGNTKKVSIVIVAIAWIVLTIIAYFSGYTKNLDDRIRGHDPVGYFVYLPSLIFDHDLDFSNNFQVIYGDNQTIRKKTSTGYTDNPWSIGPAILWSPFYITAHLCSKISKLCFDTNYEPNGYKGLYSISVMIGNAVYILIGCIFLYLFLSTFFNDALSVFSTITILFGSQITYYTWGLIPMSHNVSFASVCMYLFLYRKYDTKAITALSAGIMILARWQNALFLIPQIAINFTILGKWLRNREFKQWSKFLMENCIFSLIVIICFIPQGYVWYKLYGSFITLPQAAHYSGDTFKFGHYARFLWTLFHPNHGLFLWNPILLISCFGFIPALKNQRYRKMAISLIVMFTAQWVVNSLWQSWHGDWGFGQRKFCNTLPVFAFGLCMMLSYFKKSKIIFYTLVSISMVLIVFNLLFVYQVYHGLVPRSKALYFHELTYDKLRLKKIRMAQACANQAVYELTQKKNIDAFYKLAKRSLIYDENSREVFAVNGLRLLIQNNGNSNEQLTFFTRWYKIEKDNILAMIGLMITLYENRQYNASNAMLDKIKNNNNYGSYKQIISVIEPQMKSRDAATLANQALVTKYFEYFKELRLD